MAIAVRHHYSLQDRSGGSTGGGDRGDRPPPHSKWEKLTWYRKNTFQLSSDRQSIYQSQAVWQT